MNFTQQYLSEAGRIIRQLDTHAIERVVTLLAETRTREGQLFILGDGGGAGCPQSCRVSLARCD